MIPVLTIDIRFEHDTVAVRQRARQIARLAGFDGQDQARIATAVSEIARNAFRYADTHSRIGAKGDHRLNIFSFYIEFHIKFCICVAV